MSASNAPLGAFSASAEPPPGVALTKHDARNPVAPFVNSCAAAAARAVALDLLLYCVVLTLCIRCANPVGKLLLALIEGVVIARLFILGHDAAHGSLFPRKWMNDAIGRFVFLFTATPFSLWQLGHNTIHHGFTNLRGRDTVWTPHSPAEFAALPVHRRVLQRIYRTPLGVALYYTVELWWKKLFFPSEREVAVARRSHRIDCLIVVSYFIGLTLLVIDVCAHSPASAALNLLIAVVLPVAVFFWLMGFTIFLHHTHPSVRWFANRAEWSFAGAQLEGTVHILLPKWANLIMHNIFEHTAHHVDVRVPFYHLAAAQAAVESALGSHVVIEKFSFRGFRNTLQCCALYDYDQHCWLRFDSSKGDVK